MKARRARSLFVQGRDQKNNLCVEASASNSTGSVGFTRTDDRRLDQWAFPLSSFVGKGLGEVSAQCLRLSSTGTIHFRMFSMPSGVNSLCNLNEMERSRFIM